MKVFVSYKETGVPEEELLNRIWEIKWILDYLEYDSFIFWYDMRGKAFDSKEVVWVMQQQIASSDLVLSFVNYSERSEWELLELGMAYAMGKPIINFINEEVESWYRLIDVIWEKILFKGFNDFRSKLFQYFGLYLPRDRIDKIDEQLLKLLSNRFKWVYKIWKYKKITWEELFQSQRWEQVISSRVALAQRFGLSEEFIKKVWDLIHQEAIDREKLFKK